MPAIDTNLPAVIDGETGEIVQSVTPVPVTTPNNLTDLLQQPKFYLICGAFLAGYLYAKSED